MFYEVFALSLVSTFLSFLAFFVMSEASKSSASPVDDVKKGPGYFGYYKSEIVELLSQDDGSTPLTSQSLNLSTKKFGEVKDKDKDERSNGLDSVFGDIIGAGLSDFEKERLKSLLRQGAIDLSREVDEMLDPVFSMCQLQNLFLNRKCLPSDVGAPSKYDAEPGHPKKLKRSSSSSTGIPANGSPCDCESCREGSGKGMSNVKKNCVSCQSKETSEWITGPEWPKEDLQFLLENDSPLVEKTIKKYSDELVAKLGSMEQQLEELLDAVASKSRSMSLHEKHKLQKLIQRLPPNKLDRVAELIQRGKPSVTNSPAELFVDLEQQDNMTLWRLYYYVQAVEKARSLSS